MSQPAGLAGAPQTVRDHEHDVVVPASAIDLTFNQAVVELEVPVPGSVTRPAGGSWFEVAGPLRDRALADEVCRRVLDEVRARLGDIRIDAYFDFRRRMPDGPRHAQQLLRERGAAQGLPDSGMSIHLDGRSAADVELAQAYAAWSISCRLYALSDGALIASFDDSAALVAFRSTADGAVRIAATLPGELSLRRLTGSEAASLTWAVDQREVPVTSPKPKPVASSADG